MAAENRFNDKVLVKHNLGACVDMQQGITIIKKEPYKQAGHSKCMRVMDTQMHI